MKLKLAWRLIKTHRFHPSTIPLLLRRRTCRTSSGARTRSTPSWTAVSKQQGWRVLLLPVAAAACAGGALPLPAAAEYVYCCGHGASSKRSQLDRGALLLHATGGHSLLAQLVDAAEKSAAAAYYSALLVGDIPNRNQSLCVPPAVMREAFEAIWELHTEDKIPLRTAAFVKALQASCWRSPHAAAVRMLPCPHAAAAGRTARAMHCLLASKAWHFCASPCLRLACSINLSSSPARLPCPALQRVTRARVHRGFD